MLFEQSEESDQVGGMADRMLRRSKKIQLELHIRVRIRLEHLRAESNRTFYE